MTPVTESDRRCSSSKLRSAIESVNRKSARAITSRANTEKTTRTDLSISRDRGRTLAAMRALCLLAIAGCGRYAFDPLADTGRHDGAIDMHLSDGMGLDCAAAWQAATVTFLAPVDITPFDTVGRDHDPVLLPDRLTMYFSSSRPGSVNGDDDVWRASRPSPDAPWDQLERVLSLSSELDEGAFFTRDDLRGWQSTERMGGEGNSDLWLATRTTTTEPFTLSQPTLASINDNAPQFDAWVSLDQLRLYYSVNGILLVSERALPSDPWPAPTNVAGADIGNGAYDPTLTADELALVFTADDVDSLRDIYVATRPSRTAPFGPRLRLPISISGAYDYDAWLSADACEVYWASDRGRSIGDLALWVARVVP